MPEHEERRGTYGNVIKYTAGDDWESYTEQLEFYFIANEVQDEKRKKAILLANMCAETFQLLKDLLVPAKPKDDAATYDVRRKIGASRSVRIRQPQQEAGRVGECVRGHAKTHGGGL